MRAGTATVLFTDLVGSTELRSRLGDDLADQLRREHDALLADAVVAHQGVQVKWMGDGFMATFGAAADAIACALGMQRAIHRFNRGAPEPLGLRVGLSAGDVAWEEGDCFGAPVVEAKRLCDAAAGGQVLISEVVRLLAGTRGNHQLRFVGGLDLKGLADPFEAYEVAWEPAEDNDLALPAALADAATETPFVGRTDERQRMETAWKRARHGQRSMVLLGGNSASARPAWPPRSGAPPTARARPRPTCRATTPWPRRWPTSGASRASSGCRFRAWATTTSPPSWRRPSSTAWAAGDGPSSQSSSARPRGTPSSSNRSCCTWSRRTPRRRRAYLPTPRRRPALARPRGRRPPARRRGLSAGTL